MRWVWRRTKTIRPDLQKRVHHPPLGRLEPTRRGPNASCTIRPVLSVIASHLEMAPTDESHLLVWCVRISFGGEAQRREVPASERAWREAPRPQKITGIIHTANLVRTNAQVASSLRRNLSSCPAEGACSATVSVPLVPSGETTSVTVSGALFDQRLNQTDLPLTKIFRYSRGSIQGMLDLYNAFNSRAPQTINSAYGPIQGVYSQAAGGELLPDRLISDAIYPSGRIDLTERPRGAFPGPRLLAT